MSESNHRTTTDRHRRLTAVSTAVLAMLTVGTSVVAEDAGLWTFEEQPLAVVHTTIASGFDLQATLSWSDTAPLPTTAELRLFDSSDALVATTIIATAAGQRTMEVLPGALGGLFTQGFQYRLEVVDLASGTAMAPLHHLRIFIDCPASGICNLRSVDGLEADRVAMDKELMLLLDDLENNGSQDLLSDALGGRPDMRGEILTLAEQLSDLDQEYSLEGCVCLWAPSFTESQEGEQSLGPNLSASPHAGFATGGSAGPGVAFHTIVQTFGGLPRTMHLAGHSEAIMDLRCWNFSEWSIEAFQLVSSSNSFEVSMPVLELCHQNCGAGIDSQAVLGGQLEVEAYGTDSNDASAMAGLDIQYSVVDQANQEHQLFSTYTEARADAVAQTVSKDLVRIGKTADRTLPGSRLTAVMTTLATMSIAASDDACALAIAKFNFKMAVTGGATCAVEPTSNICLPRPPSPGDDGLETECWGHPQ